MVRSKRESSERNRNAPVTPSFVVAFYRAAHATWHDGEETGPSLHHESLRRLRRSALLEA
jgi:hypothetical protein